MSQQREPYITQASPSIEITVIIDPILELCRAIERGEIGAEEGARRIHAESWPDALKGFVNIYEEEIDE